MLASIVAVGTLVTVVTRSEAFVEYPATLEAALPMPPLPQIGTPFPTSTGRGHIVVVQTPPQGRRVTSMDGWIVGTPEQVASTRGANPSGRFHRPEKEFPKEGSVGWYLKSVDPTLGMADITFEDRTGDVRRKLVRIKDQFDSPVADLYLRGNSVRINLPVGRYGLSIAVGRRWEGTDTLFGPYGSYFDLSPMDLSMTRDQVMYTRVLGAVTSGPTSEVNEGVRRVSPADM